MFEQLCCSEFLLLRPVRATHTEPNISMSQSEDLRWLGAGDTTLSLGFLAPAEMAATLEALSLEEGAPPFQHGQT